MRTLPYDYLALDFPFHAAFCRAARLLSTFPSDRFNNKAWRPHARQAAFRSHSARPNGTRNVCTRGQKRGKLSQCFIIRPGLVLPNVACRTARLLSTFSSDRCEATKPEVPRHEARRCLASRAQRGPLCVLPINPQSIVNIVTCYGPLMAYFAARVGKKGWGP